MKVPFSIMDEHRDAYYHWNAMIEAGYIPPKGNYLLHVDHHDDMEAGAYAWDMTNMPKTAAEAFAFTDQCLGIADFIIPALWQGIFSVCHVVKNLTPVIMRPSELYVSYDPVRGLYGGGYIPFIHAKKRQAGDPRYSFYQHRENGLNGKQDLEGAESLVLDVDLDYFCWDNSLHSVPKKKIELTKEGYEDYMTNRNHPFRIIPKKLVHAEIIDGRYYLVYEEAGERDPLPSEAWIDKRIARFFGWLRDCEVTPAAIDVCRSSYSGYLPAERAEFVERRFMEELGKLYDLEPASYKADLTK